MNLQTSTKPSIFAREHMATPQSLAIVPALVLVATAFEDLVPRAAS
jgi:hypothetical protein